MSTTSSNSFASLSRPFGLFSCQKRVLRLPPARPQGAPRRAILPQNVNSRAYSIFETERSEGSIPARYAVVNPLCESDNYTHFCDLPRERGSKGRQAPLGGLGSPQFLSLLVTAAGGKTSKTGA